MASNEIVYERFFSLKNVFIFFVYYFIACGAIWNTFQVLQIVEDYQASQGTEHQKTERR